MSLTAVVPVKGAHAAKQRLAAVLSPPARQRLLRLLLQRTVVACRAAVTVTDVVVVAGDATVAGWAATLGVTVLDDGGVGLQSALDAADALLDRRAAEASLVLPVDLPLVTGRALDEFVRAAPAGDGVAVVRAADGGTGALLRRPATVIATAFGPGSGGRHLERAAGAGLPATSIVCAALSRDLDTPADLAALAQEAQGAWLRRLSGRSIRAPRAVLPGARPLTATLERSMPQGTVKHFNLSTRSGSLMTDNGEELTYDAETFAASGLVELRLGQRVRFRIEGEGDDRRVRDLQIVSL